jgi:hypothetical protein
VFSGSSDIFVKKIAENCTVREQLYSAMVMRLHYIRRWKFSKNYNTREKSRVLHKQNILKIISQETQALTFFILQVNPFLAIKLRPMCLCSFPTQGSTFLPRHIFPGVYLRFTFENGEPDTMK